MKTISLMIFSVLFCAVCFASEPSLAQVLEWKYGFVASTKQDDPNDMSNNPKMVISEWKHQVIPQPDEAQLAIDKQEYIAHLAQIEADSEAEKEALKEKLKVSDSDLEALKKVING